MEQTIFLDKFVWANPEDTDHWIIIQQRCSGVHFEIRYLQSNLAVSPYLLTKHEESMRIMWASEEGNTRDIELSIIEIDRLRNAFDAIVIQLSTSLKKPDDHLDNFLYPLCLIIDAIAPDRKSTAIQPYLRGKQSRSFGYPLLDWQESLKCVKSCEVRLLEPKSFNPSLRPSKVLVTDSLGTNIECIFKTCGPDVVRKLRLGQPWTYKQIEAAINAQILRSDIPVCRLYGIVVDCRSDIPTHSAQFAEEDIVEWECESSSSEDEHNGCGTQQTAWGPTQHASRVPVSTNTSEGISHNELILPRLRTNMEYRDTKLLVGILVLYIENKGTVHDLAPWSDCSNSRRSRWADELEQLVRELHAVGIVWGDAKPHNLLIDLEDRLWIIDLDGSYTNGWVDEDKKESEQGDLQGVINIKKWLLACSENPVSRAQ